MAFSGYSRSDASSASSISRYAPYGGHPITFSDVSRTYQWRPRRRDASSSSSSEFNETRSSGRHRWSRGWHSHRSSRSGASTSSTDASAGPRGGANSRTHGQGDRNFNWWSEYRDTEDPRRRRRVEGAGTRPPGRGISRRWGRWTDPDSFSSGSEEDFRRVHGDGPRHRSLHSEWTPHGGRPTSRYRHYTSRPRDWSRSSSSGDDRPRSDFYGRRRPMTPRAFTSRRRSRSRGTRTSSSSSTDRGGRPSTLRYRGWSSSESG